MSRRERASVILSPDELAALTGRQKAKAQARELDHMGIPYRRRRDGSLAVLRIHVDTVAPTAARQDEPAKPRVRFD